MRRSVRSPPARPRAPAHRRVRRRPRRPAGRRAPPHRSRRGCRASARRRGRSAARRAATSITPMSPIRTRSRASSPLAAPMSMCRFLSSGGCLRSSSSSWWIALRPITPRTVPPRVSSTIRWPTSWTGSHPPTWSNRRKPSSSMCVTWTPISSMWPTIASDGPSAMPATRAHEEPLTIDVDLGRERLAPRAPHRRGAVSWPDGPGVFNSSVEQLRNRHRVSFRCPAADAGRTGGCRRGGSSAAPSVCRSGP